jgi:NAD(P)-dependent dehydrogenase (short-subunit alcohol dehydrogenase family)
MELHEGQVAVVTGAASGIGFGIATAMAKRGLMVVMADIEDAALGDAVASLEANGAVALPVVTDVSDGAQVDELARRTLERFGRVDVVCNNAGVATYSKPTWEMDELDWQWVLGVNLWGVIHGIRSFVPTLIAQGHGHVVNTASIVGLSVGPEIAPYTASKHAVVAISETMRGELATRAPGIGVTVLCHSYVPTRIGEAQRNRPAELTPDWTVAVEGTQRDRSVYRGVPPTEVGEMVAGAVESGRFYLTTSPEAAALVRHRVDAILAEISG